MNRVDQLFQANLKVLRPQEYKPHRVGPTLEFIYEVLFTNNIPFDFDSFQIVVLFQSLTI